MDVGMKGITCCADCVYYSKRKHKCVRCNNVESDARKHFYDDCPLQDVKPVVHGHWEVAIGYDINRKVECSECNRMNFEPSDYCPNCGARMDSTIS